MGDIQTIQWFPGHMSKALRKIKENLKLVDLVVEVVDARIPMSSRNPDLEKIIGEKPRAIVMNKIDIADPVQTNKWLEHYREDEITAIAIDCKSGSGLKTFSSAVKSTLAQKMDSWNKKGMVGRSIRIMVVGIPNVGKSTFINRLISFSKAKVEDRPGVTRGNQWFSLGKDIDLLDTPGVLWPKFDDKTVGENLAFTGAVKDQILDIESLAIRLIEKLERMYAGSLAKRFKIDVSFKDLSAYDCLKMIAQKRGMFISGGELDLERASIMLIDEFRSAKIGRVTLERFN